MVRRKLIVKKSLSEVSQKEILKSMPVNSCANLYLKDGKKNTKQQSFYFKLVSQSLP